jgi:hypothetical protein
VTELMDRLKVSTTTLFGLPPSLADLDVEERRILRATGFFAIAVLWFTVALVEAWLLVVLPITAAACAVVIRRRRALAGERSDEGDDWY